MNRRYLPLALVATFVASACTVTLPAAQVPPTGTQPVFVSSGPAGKNPVIQSFTANPTNVTKGQPITFQVVAHDPNNETLQFNWSATGGTLSATTGQALMWTPPEKPGVYTVMVAVTNGRGGIVTGSLNLTVQADGNAAIGSAASPSPSPSFTPSATVAPSTPTPSPSVSPSPTASMQPSPSPTASPSSLVSLNDFSRNDFDYFGRVNGTLKLRIQSNKPDKSRYTCDLMSFYSYGSSSWRSLPSAADGTIKVELMPAVMILSFRDKPLIKDDLSSRTIGLYTRVDGIAFPSPFPLMIVTSILPFSRANWKLPDDLKIVEEGLAIDPRFVQGKVFVFKHEGGDMDLGTFELP